ncbi:MAG: hypothetical protein WBF67_06610 [Olleya sp.]
MISQAVTSMKYNNSLRKKHRKMNAGLSVDKIDNTELNFPIASKKDIVLLRQKLQKEHKQKRIKYTILLSIIMVVLMGTLIYFA